MIQVISMTMNEYSADLQEKLDALRNEHKDLDNRINDMLRSGTVDFVEMQRMKKRKLGLKDMIQKLESELLPDIIA